METHQAAGLPSIDEYLSSEEFSPRRREYNAGFAYVVPENADAHNVIAGNLIAEMRPRVPGRGCRLYAFEMKARLFVAGKHIFYYPDVMVTCDPRDTATYFKEYPKVIVEVLSEGTERVDRHEKFSNYVQIETLQEYVLVCQDRMEVTVFRRSRDWKPQIFGRGDEEVRLDSVDFKMRLEGIYENVSF